MIAVFLDLSGAGREIQLSLKPIEESEGTQENNPEKNSIEHHNNQFHNEMNNGRVYKSIDSNPKAEINAVMDDKYAVELAESSIKIEKRGVKL